MTDIVERCESTSDHSMQSRQTSSEVLEQNRLDEGDVCHCDDIAEHVGEVAIRCSRRLTNHVALCSYSDQSSP